jgi:hypothetical protein
MKDPDKLQSLGALLKEETLQTVDHYVVQNTLVLESLEPFPGYHGEMPFDSKPDSIFLITEKQYLLENVFRTSQYLYNYHQFSFDSCPAEIFIHNTHLFSIRIKGLNNYSYIADLQSYLINHGISFMKKKKISAPGLIRIDKIFSLDLIEHYIYKDLDDDKTFYLEIPFHFNWNLFKKTTEHVKNNIDNSNFDAALGFIYLKEIMDFIRIYTKNPDIKRLQGIRNKYLEEIKRIQEI